MTDSDYAEGDFVEVVKGRTRISGVLAPGYASSLFIEGFGRSIGTLKRDGYTVTVIERAKPALPTEPGFYLTDYSYNEVFELTAAGDWYCGTDAIPVERVIHDAGDRLVRLEPVPETAKKVLEAVRVRLSMPLDGRRPNGEFMIRTETLDSIGTQFGVTGDAS